MTATPEQINALGGELKTTTPELTYAEFLDPYYDELVDAAKSAKAHAIKRNAEHRQDRARVDGVVLLWGLSLVALGLAVMM